MSWTDAYVRPINEAFQDIVNKRKIELSCAEIATIRKEVASRVKLWAWRDTMSDNKWLEDLITNVKNNSVQN